MSFFTDPEIKPIIEKWEKQQNDFYDPIPQYAIGSTLLYSPKTESFAIFNETTVLKNIDHYISLGIILEQLEDGTFIVMYKNVLNCEPVQVNAAIYNDKNCGGILSAIFKTYCKQLYKKLENTEKTNIRKNIDFVLPNNKHMDLINKYQDIIIKKIEEITNKQKADNLKYKLEHNNIFCNIGGYICLWHKPTKFKKNYYEEINSYTTGYFLPIFIFNFANLK